MITLSTHITGGSTRRTLLLGGAALASALAGCSANGDPGRLDLTVSNETDAPVDARVTVTGPDGESYENEMDRIDSGVSRAFEVVVGASGRHELTVAGDDWTGSLAWNADDCLLYDGQVRVTETAVETAGACVDSR